MANFNQYAAESFLNFQFFIGVVEARDDPLKLGRVKVRCYGIHSDNRSDISSEQLPWAMPVMPYTSASISGVGTSPTGPVEGSWVFGFFLDGKEMQQPMVLGTMVGAPTDLPKFWEGFNDPDGIYPKIEDSMVGVGESDINKLARGDDIYNATEFKTLTVRSGETTFHTKVRDRTTSIPKAVPPKVPAVKDGSPPGTHPITYFKREFWDEPYPRYGDNTRYKSVYPLNHVHVSESGHVFETDDTLGAGRIHQYHRSGTFYEIQNDGTRITKVVGDDYEVVMKNKNMVVRGNVNITVDQGDLRLYVHKEKVNSGDPPGKGGDMYVECDGDYNLNIKGDMTTKIQGSEHKEVITDSSTQINGKQSLRVTKDRVTNIGGAHREDIGTVTAGSNHEQTITGSKSVTVGNNSNQTVTNEITIAALTDNATVSSGNNINIKSTSNTNMEIEKSLNVDTTEKIDMDATLNVEITTPQKVDVDGTSGVDIDGGDIHLNKDS